MRKKYPEMFDVIINKNKKKETGYKITKRIPP